MFFYITLARDYDYFMFRTIIDNRGSILGESATATNDRAHERFEFQAFSP